MAGIPRGFERYRPWWRGWYQGYGFNPVADLPGLAFYHDIKVQDSTFQGLPGMAYAINQNDGIGAVLDIKRYKERGAELVTIPEIQGTPISSPGSTVVDQLYPTGATVEAGKLYELKFSVSDFDGVSTVGVTGVLASPVIGVTRLNADGTAHGLFVALAGGGLSMFTREGNTANFSGISVREIPGYHAIQDVAAAQPVLNIEGGVRSALFDGVDDRLVVPNSTGAFKFLHNGQGGELHVCCRFADTSTTRYLIGNANAANPGVILYATSGGQLRGLLSNGSGSYIATAVSASGAVVAGEKFVASLINDNGTISVRKNGVEVASAVASGALSTADASYNMAIGASYDGGPGTFNGDMYSWAPVQGILSDYDRQRLVNYMLRRAGA